MKALILVVALCGLTGCGTFRSLAGPDPGVASHLNTYKEGMEAGKAAHPEKAQEYEAAWRALETYVTSDAAGVLNDVVGILGLLLTPGNIALAGTALVAYLNHRGKKSGDEAHDENATRLDALEAKLAPPSTPA